MDTEETYKKLPGRGRKLSTSLRRKVTLWLGQDHLLQIDNSGYTEYYKRFYFKDIQSISLRRTFSALDWVFVGIAVLSALSFTFAGMNVGRQDVGLVIFFGVAITGCFLGFSIWSFIKGPTCECVIKTAVQQETLPSLKRLKNARKALAQINAAIVAYQGELSERDIEAMNVAAYHQHFDAAVSGGFATPSRPGVDVRDSDRY